ncbi:putative 2-oxoglutarate-dependent dioxygenase, partial [Cucurbita argyrosperma subsp. argyrosperma]
MDDFDQAFIQAPEHRPKLSDPEADGIPTVDLSPIFNSPDGTFPDDLVRQIASASADWGFFFVVNHGVPPEKQRRIEAAAREFFGQSLEEKRKVRRDEGVVTGYSNTELTKNVRDWKEVFDFVVADPTVVPASPEPDDDQLTNLGLPAERFRDYFKETTSFGRLNHYPPCPSPELALGVGRHKDPGVLTVLAQDDDVEGLEVKRKRDGEWIRVKPVPDSYVVNAWSNERYESVEHRAMVNHKRERYSIAFFFNPSHSTIVEPLKELIDPENPPKYKSYSWGKYLSNRMLSNFKKLNVDNIQAGKEYAEELEKLGHKLVELIAVSLGLPAQRFRDYFKEKTSMVRLNHYPPCSLPEMALGVGRHNDPGVLTMLAQDDVGGLEVKRKRDGEWIRVKPVPDSYVVNVGNVTQVWSNERYESVEHRVMVNDKKERYSIAFFFNPSHSTIVEPLEELIDPENPPKYQSYLWGKLLFNKCARLSRDLKLQYSSL